MTARVEKNIGFVWEYMLGVFISTSLTFLKSFKFIIEPPKAKAEPKIIPVTAPYSFRFGEEEVKKMTNEMAMINFPRDSIIKFPPKLLKRFIPCITPLLTGRIR